MIKASDLDKKFDDGEDISPYFDMSTATRPNQDAKRVNVDFPQGIVTALDLAARQIGITRQALIKVWIAERLEQEKRV